MFLFKRAWQSCLALVVWEMLGSAGELWGGGDVHVQCFYFSEDLTNRIYEPEGTSEKPEEIGFY